MTKLLHKTIATLLCLVISISAFAKEVWVNDVCYILNDENNTASVCASQSVSDVVIEGEITSDGNAYTVTHIIKSAFYGNKKVVNLTIPSTIKSIEAEAFMFTNNLRSVYISDLAAWCEIEFGDGYANPLCKAISLYLNKKLITDLVIPESITKIKRFTFCEFVCSSITIHDKVTDIEAGAFAYSKGFKAVYINDLAAWCNINFGSSYANPLSFAKKMYLNNRLIERLEIPETVSHIGQYAFAYNEAITSVKIPSSVTSIGSDAFGWCFKLKEVHVSNIDSWCKIEMSDGLSNPLSYAKEFYVGSRDLITDLVIPNTVSRIEKYTFYCCNFNSVTIPTSVVSIGESAFWGNKIQNLYISDWESWCKVEFGDEWSNPFHDFNNYSDNNIYVNGEQVKDVVIPDAITKINAFALNNVNNFLSFELPCNLADFTWDSFGYNSKLYVERGSLSHLKAVSCFSQLYDKTTREVIDKTKNNASSTLTSITLVLQNQVPGWTYAIGMTDNSFQEPPYPYFEMVDENSTVVFNRLMPYTYYKYIIYVKRPGSDWVSLYNSGISTKKPEIYLSAKTTASSVDFGTPSCNVNKKDVDDLSLSVLYDKLPVTKLSGLDPSTSITVNLIAKITVDGKTKEIRDSKTFSTEALDMKNYPSKVINAGDVIVAAQTNLDDDETNVGFEWRRKDWDSSFDSNTGTAYLYEGMIEGYIRNLYTQAFWQCRPYYISNSDKYYYGDWVSIDPTNTSYFEATVHTYSNIQVEGNTALVKGYSLRGTDAITAQGFRYWKTTSASNERAARAMTGVHTVEAKGTIMNATLTDLEYETTYSYQAFAETSDGEAVLGEIRAFTTGNDPALSIDDVTTNDRSSEAYEVACYDITGKMISKPVHGLNIIKMSDGTRKKIFVK